MAKARLSLNEEEQQIVERARALSKLKARRRRTADELAALDKEINTMQLAPASNPASSDSSGYGHGV